MAHTTTKGKQNISIENNTKIMKKNRKDNNQQKNFIQGFETPIRWFKVQFWEKT